MEAAIDRIMMTYDLLMNRSAAASAEARAKVTDYLTTLFEAGEKDTHRLTVCGLTYLRELDGSQRSGEGRVYGAVVARESATTPLRDWPSYPRKQGIQYAAASRSIPDTLEYWFARSSRAMTPCPRGNPHAHAASPQ